MSCKYKLQKKKHTLGIHAQTEDKEEHIQLSPNNDTTTDTTTDTAPYTTPDKQNKIAYELNNKMVEQVCNKIVIITFSNLGDVELLFK